MIEQTYFLDMIPGESTPPVVHVSQFDVNSRTLTFNLMKGGVAFVPDAGMSVTLDGMKPDNHVFSYPMTVNGSSVSIDVLTQMTVVSGHVRCEVSVSNQTGKIGSANFILAVEESPIDSGSISESDIPIFEDLKNQAQQAAADAEQSASDAESAASSVSSIVPSSAGTAGQVLTKTATGADWKTPTGGQWGGITGNLSDQTDLNNALTELNSNLDKLDDAVFGVVSDDWGVIQKQVELGLAKKLYPVGTQFTVHHDAYGDVLFDVVQHITPESDALHKAMLPTGKEYGMVLLMHNVINGTQFDEVEGFYYCEDGLTAGTYNVTITRQPWFAGDVGKTFQFTLTDDVPAGAILCWDGYNATREGRTVRVFNTREATSAAQTATMTEGNEGTALGSVDGTGNFNIFDRSVLGSNDWEESGVRQWLNADVASDWWEPKTRWDRLVNYYSRPGFLYGFGADFKNVLVETTHGNRSNTVFDSHGTKKAYSTSEKIFLLCNEEVNLAQEQEIVCGKVFDYYKDAANADRIKYDITSTGTARLWWLRSPYPSSAHTERFVGTSGALSNRGASDGYGVAAACVIAGNENTSGSIVEKVEANETAINSLAGSLAMIETSPATANHAVGSYLMLNNRFCKVTSAIATGESIIVGSNVQYTTVAEELAAILAQINA